MLSWFEDLEPGERSSAMAIVDDRVFVKFYTLLLREEQQQQQQHVPSHALFMKDYLDSLFERAKVKSPRDINYGDEGFLSAASKVVEGADNIADATLLSYLSASYVNSGDCSDFTDPYHFALCTLSKTDHSTKRNDTSDDRYSNTISNPDSSSSNLASPVPIQKLLASVAEPKSQSTRKLGLESAISNLFDTAVLNVVNKLGNEYNERERRKTVETKNGKVQKRKDGDKNGDKVSIMRSTPEQMKHHLLKLEKSEKAECEHFSISTILHSALATSFATSATNTFDCIFFLRPATEDCTKLMEIFYLLSNGLMFSRRPSEEEIKLILTSKGVPMISWLADILKEPHGSPVPYYMLLLSRIELSIWSAYCNAIGSTAYIGGEDTTGSDVVSNNIMMLPRSKKGKGKANSSKIPFSVRNTLRVLELSSLTRLPSTAVMLSLGCMAEEFKIFWRTMSKYNKAKVQLEIECIRYLVKL